MDEKLSAMLTGLIGVTAVNVIRRDDDNNNRIRNQQDDLDSLSRRFRDFSSNGHILRQFMPTVADLLAGTALARSSEQAATLLPTLSTISRPDLVSSMASAVKAFSWPPTEGEYTSNGYITKAGELTSLGLVLTYEEVRAFLHGLVLSTSPSTEAKGQAYGAASSLMRAIIEQSYTLDGWQATWRRLFGGTTTKHSAAPTITSLNPLVAIVTGAGANDGALNIKMTVSGAVDAGAQLVKVTFGTKYANPPAVVVGGPHDAASVTISDFTISTRVAYAANDVVQVQIVVGSCDAV